MNPDTRAKVEAWLRYFEDLGLAPFYSDRASLELPAPAPVRVDPRVRQSAWAVPHPLTAVHAPAVMPVKQAPSLFEVLDRVEGDTLERVRADLGDCTRCRLCKQRNTIVFGVGNPQADIMFVGEGPGAEEDAQGIPFVGRAGQLLTQMVEAMGLRREDVYIANVIKCRPPENRTPEKDEIATCSPFLLRQIDVIRPKVLVALGACAAQTLLASAVSITRIRGQWYDYRGIHMLPTYHPAYLLRNPYAKPDAWRDLQKVMAVLGLKKPLKQM